MKLDLEALKARLENANREPYQGRQSITMKIADVVELIKEVERLRKLTRK
jgi:hypothetical protein